MTRAHSETAVDATRRAPGVGRGRAAGTPPVLPCPGAATRTTEDFAQPLPPFVGYRVTLSVRLRIGVDEHHGHQRLSKLPSRTTPARYEQPHSASGKWCLGVMSIDEKERDAPFFYSHHPLDGYVPYGMNSPRGKVLRYAEDLPATVPLS